MSFELQEPRGFMCHPSTRCSSVNPFQRGHPIPLWRIFVRIFVIVSVREEDIGEAWHSHTTQVEKQNRDKSQEDYGEYNHHRYRGNAVKLLRVHIVRNIVRITHIVLVINVIPGIGFDVELHDLDVQVHKWMGWIGSLFRCGHDLIF